MNHFIRMSAYWLLATLSLLSLNGCGGGYGESTNGYLSESRSNARDMLMNSGSTPSTPTPNPDTLDQALLTTGARYYEEQCTSCHGSDGRGSTPLINCGSCKNLEILSYRTLTTMPPPGGACDQECADSTAYYILAGFPDLQVASASPTPTTEPTSAPTSTPSSTPTPISSPTPTSNGMSEKPIALIANPTSDLIGFASYTATFISASTDDTGITRTQWYVNNVEQTQASSFTNTFIQGRYSIKLVVTDQDNQTSETSVILEVVSNGQTAQACDAGNVFMAKRLWTPFINKCLACHQAGGLAGGKPPVLIANTDKFYLSKNFDSISSLLLGSSTLIRDRAQGKSHGGGTVVPASQTSIYADLAELQNRVNTPPSACPTP